jgi:ribosomal protein S18 acetylase RimI-like enzyme
MIRILREHDTAALRTLRLRSLQEEPDAFLSSYDAEAAEPEAITRDRLRRLEDSRDAGVLGAFDDTTLVGMLGIMREQHVKASHRATLWGMYVAPEALKRGVGGALVDAAVKRLRAAGLEQAHLTVSATADAARRLYERSGFIVVGTLRSAMKDGTRYIDET